CALPTNQAIPVSVVKQAESRASFPWRNHAGKHRLKQRTLSAHPDSPEDHSNQCKDRCAQKNERCSGSKNQKGEQRHIRTKPVKQPAQRNGCKSARCHCNCIKHGNQATRLRRDKSSKLASD